MWIDIEGSPVLGCCLDRREARADRDSRPCSFTSGMAAHRGRDTVVRGSGPRPAPSACWSAAACRCPPAALAAALGDKASSLGADAWRLLAFYSWDTDEQQVLPTSQLPATLGQIAAAVPADLAALRDEAPGFVGLVTVPHLAVHLCFLLGHGQHFFHADHGGVAA